MQTVAPLTETEVQQFIKQWFHKLDIHAPLEEMLAMIADEEIEFRFPEVTVTSKDGFAQWYQRVTHTFFDEVHETKELAITMNGGRATIKIATQWQEGNWNPPAPRSERKTYLARQTWSVKRSEKTMQPVIVTYFVDAFDLVEDAVTPPTTTSDVINRYYETANRGDWNAWLALFADDIVMDEQLAGHLEGLNALRGAVNGLKKGYSRFQNKPEHTVIDGNQACVISHISAANASNIPIEANVANYFRVENNKITYLANFHDTVPFAPFVKQKVD
ncbi:MAG TPA: nuclear transport factor 2 family protein [Ktedonobacteraceae bacterium]|nr:nuclear transport factor 2 family protein [Ktedonobacteraceae bacterium]